MPRPKNHPELAAAGKAVRKAAGLSRKAGPPSVEEADALAGWTRDQTGLNYPEKIKMAIIDKAFYHMEGGCNIISALRKIPGAPSATMLQRWVRELAPEKREPYIKARLEGYLMLAEEIHEISDTPVMGRTVRITKSKDSKGNDVTVEEVITEAEMLGHRQLQVATRKWLLAKMLPKIFGERLVLDAPDGQAFADSLKELAKKLPV